MGRNGLRTSDNNLLACRKNYEKNEREFSNVFSAQELKYRNIEKGALNNFSLYKAVFEPVRNCTFLSQNTITLFKTSHNSCKMHFLT